MRRVRVFALLIVTVNLVGAGPVLGGVVINEIMYNSPGATDVEWVELLNNTPAATDLTGWYLLDDDPTHPPCPLSGLLGPGEFWVVAGDLALFATEYPTVTNLNPATFQPGYSLGNGGDAVMLYDAGAALRDGVVYSDSGDWPTGPDGNGPTLELLNPNLDNSLATSWAASVISWGTPGEQNSVYVSDQPPLVSDVARDIALPQSGDAVTITARASDEEGLDHVELHVNLGSQYVAQSMLDDGLHGDGAPGDSIFGATIPAQGGGTLVKYYVSATDGLQQTTTYPPNAPADYLAYTVGYTPPKLLINEILASNVNGIVDEAGQHEDWVEIWNHGTTTVNLSGMFLTDDMNDSRKWMMPPFMLHPDDVVIVWADNDPQQGPLHATFKLAAEGEEVGLYETVDHGNVLVHGFKFGLQSPDVSWGLYHDYATPHDYPLLEEAWAPEYLAVPSPGVVSPTALFSPVVLNEFQTTSNFGGIDDWVEVYNRSLEPVDIGGWLLSDQRAVPAKWAFPPSTVLNPHGRVVVYEDALGFGFESSGEVIMLTAADSTTGMDFFDFKPQAPDTSQGRYTDGEGYWLFFAIPNPGEPNLHPIAVPGGAEPPGPVLSSLRCLPNPFNARVQFQFDLAAPAEVKVCIYAIDGRLVRVLRAGRLETGLQMMAWDGTDQSGLAVASGTYFARVTSGSTTRTVKVALVK